MNWKVKGLVQSAVSVLPGATLLNYWAQKYVTRAHENAAAVVADRLNKARWFVEQYGLLGGEVPGAQFFEFGAGWNLAGPLALYCLGANRQIVFDLAPCARLELVNDVIAKLDRIEEGLYRRPGPRLDSLAQMEARFGIVYRAPADARRTGFEPRSIDCITNTFTLEHIPRTDIEAILRECGRILKPGGIFLSFIDYQDHYCFGDSQISVYNFLQYPDRQWRWFNSRLHYQNRLRHCHYREMFARCGFEVLSEELNHPSAQDRDRLESLALAEEFQSLSFDDLEVTGSQMVCRGAMESARAGAGRSGCSERVP